MVQASVLSTLKTYVPSFLALVLFTALYTVFVFRDGAAQHHNQNFTVAKKLKAEKLSLETVTPVRDVASPLETE